MSVQFHGRLIRPYQSDGVRWMYHRETTPLGPRGGILADEMGLGKTVQVLATFVLNPSEHPTLIVCPKTLVSQWIEACEQFLRITPLVVTRGALRTSEVTDVDIMSSYIVVAPYSALESHNCLNTITFHRVVLDEAHVIKNPRSHVFAHASGVHATIRWALTGTPITRRPRDYITLAQFIGVTGTSIDTVREEFTLRRTWDDISHISERLRLPPLEIRTHIVPFASDAERALYRDIREEGRLRMLADRSKDNTARHIMEVLCRMRQATTHPQLVTDGEWRGAVTKHEELVSLMSHHPPRSKTIVFVHWTFEGKEVQRVLEQRLEKRVVRLYGGLSSDARDDVVREFTDPEGADVLVSQIEVGGVGLNLQAATHVYINSLHWNATSELQAIGRAHRTGVTHTVVVTRLGIEGTIDEWILKKQHEKLGYAADALDDERIKHKLRMPISYDDLKHLFDVM